MNFLRFIICCFKGHEPAGIRPALDGNGQQALCMRCGQDIYRQPGLRSWHIDWRTN